MTRLRWKKNARQTGLASVGSGPRGSKYHDGEKTYAVVSAHGGGWHGPVTGWYWVAGWDSDVPYLNTCYENPVTESEAKKQAQDYVKNNIPATL